MPSTAMPSKSTRVPKAVAASSASFCAASMPPTSNDGVGLGVAEALRLLEHLGVGRVLGLHPGQDVVAGAVQHADQPGDGVAGEPLGQRLDHRDAAGDRGLEAQRDAAGLGGGGELGAVAGEHRLVGGDEVLAAGERRLGGGLGRAVLAADRLDDEVDVRRGGRARRDRPPRRRPTRSTPRSRWRERAEIAAISTGRPARAAMASPWAWTILTTPAPTVPRPARPMRRGAGIAGSEAASPAS